MKYYKVTGEDGTPCNGGSGQYHLPTKRKDGTWKPGKWMPAVKGELELCANGYHLCRPQDLPEWINLRMEKQPGIYSKIKEVKTL